AIIEAIDRKKFDVLPIAITKEGKWLSPGEAAQLLPSSAQTLLASGLEFTTGDVAILGDPSHKGLISLDGNARPLPAEKLDIVFPALHGPFGEDGTLQGLLEMADVPYVGCGVLASASGMDKVAMKLLFLQADLPMCKYVWFLRSHWQKNRSKITKTIIRKLGL